MWSSWDCASEAARSASVFPHTRPSWLHGGRSDPCFTRSNPVFTSELLSSSCEKSENSSMGSGIFSFGHFRLVARERVLTKDGAPINLGSRAFDLLVALVERAGETVNREQLFK